MGVGFSDALARPAFGRTSFADSNTNRRTTNRHTTNRRTLSEEPVMTDQENAKPRLRSRLWFDNPDNPGMTALYLERYLNYGLTKEELTSGKPIIAIAQTGSDLSPCNRHHLELAKRVREGIREAGRHCVRISGASDPGNRQAADGGARPQPRLSRARRAAVRLSDRRRRAHHRLRQDHPRLPDGGGDGEHSGDRALRRPDAQRLAQW